MYQDLLRDTSFFDLLHRIDLDLAESVRRRGCGCGGVLHSARYRRKPRGGPASLDRRCCVRESFCCAEEGCRRRSTPRSVRFLGRKVFFGALVLLVPILRDGMSPERFRRLEQQLPVSRRTVLRWRRYWAEHFPTTQPWRRLRAEVPGLSAAGLPGALLAVFSESSPGRDRVLAVLGWISAAEAEAQAR